MAQNNELTWVYVDAVFDLFHFGHIEFLKKARSLGDRLIAGINSDTDVATYKPAPILSFEERLAVVEQCSLIDRVVPYPAPLHCTAEFLDTIGADFVVHGDDMPPDQLQHWYGAVILCGRFRTVSYTRGIASRDIVSRIIRRYEAGTLRDKPVRSGDT